MRRWMLAVLVAGLTWVAGSAFAGSCCGGSMSSKAGDTDFAAQCDKVITSLNLTDEQKTKISAIQEACKKDGGSEATCKKSMGQIRDLLNPAQQTKWDAGMKSCGDKAASTEASPEKSGT